MMDTRTPVKLKGSCSCACFSFISKPITKQSITLHTWISAYLHIYFIWLYNNTPTSKKKKDGITKNSDQAGW